MAFSLFSWRNDLVSDVRTKRSRQFSGATWRITTMLAITFLLIAAQPSECILLKQMRICFQVSVAIPGIY